MTYHISKTGKTLCGRLIYKAGFMYHDVKYIKRHSPKEWCKTCKMVYNSEQTSSKDLIA